MVLAQVAEFLSLKDPSDTLTRDGGRREDTYAARAKQDMVEEDLFDETEESRPPYWHVCKHVLVRRLGADVLMYQTRPC